MSRSTAILLALLVATLAGAGLHSFLVETISDLDARALSDQRSADSDAWKIAAMNKRIEGLRTTGRPQKPPASARPPAPTNLAFRLPSGAPAHPKAIADNPAARALWLAACLARDRVQWGPLLAKLRYRPDQIAQFFALESRLQSEALDVSASLESQQAKAGEPNAEVALSGQAKEETAAYQAFFGTDYAAFDAMRHAQAQRAAVSTIVTSIVGSGGGLDGNQIDALTQSLVTHATPPSSQAPAGDYDWDAVDGDASQVLSADQFQRFLQGAALQRANQRVAALRLATQS